jgi:hypothetical protein
MSATGETDGHDRGDLMTARGDNSLALDIASGPPVASASKSDSTGISCKSRDDVSGTGKARLIAASAS